jgi:hypothetical protein
MVDRPLRGRWQNKRGFAGNLTSSKILPDPPSLQRAERLQLSRINGARDRQTLPPKQCAQMEEMRVEIALAERSTSSCNLQSFPISSALPTSDVMTRSSFAFKPLLAALLVTLTQIAMAVGLLAPDGPLSYRYSTLIQHDSYWFMNIVDRGYQTIVPPIDHKVMEVSNVAFFPAYPALASVLHYGLHIDTDNFPHC